MLGPNDTAPTPTGRFLTAIMRGDVEFLLPGSMSIVDSRDVAAAIVEAIDHGRSLDRFVVGRRNYSVPEVITSVAWDSRRAEEVLAVRFRPLEEALRDAVSCFTQDLEMRGEAGAAVGGQTARLRSSSA